MDNKDFQNKNTETSPEDPSQQKKTPEQPPQRFRGFFMLMTLVLVALMAVNMVKQNHKEMAWSDFITELHRGAFSKVLVGNTTHRVTAWYRVGEDEEAGAQNRRAVTTQATAEVIENFEKECRQLQAQGQLDKISFEPDEDWTTFILAQLLPIILIFAIIYFFFIRPMRQSSGMGGALSFGRSRHRALNKDQIGVDFSMVAGIDEARDEVQEIIEFLKNPKKFQSLGARIPRGVLLVGPPGCGKTLLAKAIAGEAEVPFFSICGSDFVEMFVGVGASRVRDLFAQAKAKSPCIIFIDEIDAVGRRRGANVAGGGGGDEREQTLNAILVEMDGMESNSEVIVVAATNRKDVLDPALMRPGRFDREIRIDLPDIVGRKNILDVHARKVEIEDSVDLSVVARSTVGYSGADLAAIVNEAALMAAMKNKKAITMTELEEAKDKIRFGRLKRSSMKNMDEEDKRITAYHEAGHAVVAWYEKHVDPLHKVSIVPMGGALGVTMIVPEKDTFHMGRKKLQSQIAFALGGRVAEELFCGDISTGAYNDIEQVTHIARNMVTEWGMSEKIGPLNYNIHDEHSFQSRNFGADVTSLIESEVRDIVDNGYRQAKRTLETHKDVVENIVSALLEREILNHQDLEALFNGQSLPPLNTAKPKDPPADNTQTSSSAEPRSDDEPPPVMDMPGLSPA